MIEKTRGVNGNEKREGWMEGAREGGGGREATSVPSLGFNCRPMGLLSSSPFQNPNPLGIGYRDKLSPELRSV